RHPDPGFHPGPRRPETAGDHAGQLRRPRGPDAAAGNVPFGFDRSAGGMTRQTNNRPTRERGKVHMYARTRIGYSILAAAAFGSGFGRSIHFDTPTRQDPPASTPSIASLRAEFSRLHKEGTDLVAAAVAANRDLTAEEKSANETRFNR